MEYKEIKSKSKPIKKFYVSTMLWFVGRAIQASSKVDSEVKEIFNALPDEFTFSLGVMPNGPYMIIGKDKKGNVKYMGGNPKDKSINLDMKIKNLEAAVLLFTFQEATEIATCRDRMVVTGDVPIACDIVKILDIVEVYLLPKILAKLAVKRYPNWSISKTIFGRTQIYVRTILGV